MQHASYPSNDHFVLYVFWKELIEVCNHKGSAVYDNKTIMRGEGWRSIAIERHYVFPKQSIPGTGMNFVHQNANDKDVARAEVSVPHDSSQVQGHLALLYGVQGTDKPYLNLVTLGKHQLPSNVKALCAMPSTQRVHSG